MWEPGSAEGRPRFTAGRHSNLPRHALTGVAAFRYYPSRHTMQAMAHPPGGHLGLRAGRCDQCPAPGAARSEQRGSSGVSVPLHMHSVGTAACPSNLHASACASPCWLPVAAGVDRSTSAVSLIPALTSGAGGAPRAVGAHELKALATISAVSCAARTRKRLGAGHTYVSIQAEPMLTDHAARASNGLVVYWPHATVIGATLAGEGGRVEAQTVVDRTSSASHQPISTMRRRWAQAYRRSLYCTRVRSSKPWAHPLAGFDKPRFLGVASDTGA